MKFTKIERDNLLIELSHTDTWQALLEFSKEVDADITAALLSIDPFKDPTNTARNQGKYIGVHSLEEHVSSVKRLRDAKEDGVEINIKKQKTTDFPSYDM